MSETMTPLEIAREIVSCADHWRVKTGKPDSEAESVARAYVELREATSWRPIDAAPQDGTTVLIASPTGPTATAQFIDGTWWSSERSGPVRRNPTHWMPLPESPR